MVESKRGIVATVVLVLLLSGCAGTVRNMRELPEGTAITPQKDKAMVVFMRPSGIGYAIQSSVFDLSGEQPQLVGIVAAKTKVAYQVAPGKRTFMTIGENADFMSAELLPNRTYYAYVAPRMGMWKARFAFEPKKKTDVESAEFKSDLADCRWVELTTESTQWMLENISSIRAKRADYYPEWDRKPEAEKERLFPEDGR